MPGGFLVFPESGEALVDALVAAEDRAFIERNIASIEWWIIHYYMQGHRNIEISSWKQGSVTVSFEDGQGELQFTYEELVNQYRVEVGRLLRMSTDPVVGREGFGLSSVRDSGMGQSTLSFMTAKAGMLGKKRHLKRLIEMLVKYGTVGQLHQRIPGEDIGERTLVEIVPPWELLSIPGEIDSLEDLRGVARHRMVPYEWVKTLGLKMPDDEGKLDIQEYAYGSSPAGQGPEMGDEKSFGHGGGYSGAQADERNASKFSEGGMPRGKAKSDSAHQQWLPMTEAWLVGDHNFVSRYIVKLGHHIGHDKSYLNKDGSYAKKVVCPLSVARYISTGRFYGRGHCGINLGLNYEIEKMLGNTFQNISDYDHYGIMVVPATAGITRTQVRKRERRKVLFAEPDPVNPNYKVENIAPSNSGDFPMKGVDMGVGLQTKMSGQSELLSGSAPGRVDSAAGLGFIFETGNVNIAATLSDIADSYVQIYESMLQAARDESQDGDSLKLPILDDRMIGVVVDRENGSVSLKDNPIPNPWDVNIDIEERQLKSPEQMKQETFGMLQAQVITPEEFRILNERDGLGWPMLGRNEFESWRKATYQKLLLFNDGETPGYMTGNQDTDNPSIHLMVIGELMGSIEFSVASTAVQDAFIELKSRYEQQMGTFPDAMPSPLQMPEQGQSQQGPAAMPA